jgi:hypothetical protein
LSGWSTREVIVGLRLLLATVTVVGVVTLPAAAASGTSCVPQSPTPPAAGPGPLPGQQATQVRWTRISRTVRYGDLASVQGQVIADDAALGSAEVHLFARPVGGSWSQLATTTSAPDTGVFSFGCVAPGHTTAYRVVYAGDVLHAGSEATRRVGVARRVPDRMRQPTPTRLVHTGSVSPRYRGPVVLQRRSGGDWHRVQVGRVGDRSAWRFVLRNPRSGSYRAVVPADRRFVLSASDHVWRVRVG